MSLKRKAEDPPSRIAFKNPERSDLLWRKVDRRLSVYGNCRHGNLDDPLDELIFIILSAQTESYLYQMTFKSLRAAFHPWDRLLDASQEKITAVIRRGGLARKKAGQIKGALDKIVADTGQLSLDFLHALPNSEVQRYLLGLPGIGIKSAACIMMYSLARRVFPVDTHVWRVSRRLGLAAPVPKPSDVQERKLERSVPASLRYRLHVNLVSHGRQTCTTYRPKCLECILSDVCPSRSQPDLVWSNWRRARGVWAMASEHEVSKQQKNKDKSHWGAG
jgi:endonuclease III